MQYSRLGQKRVPDIVTTQLQVLHHPDCGVRHRLGLPDHPDHHPVVVHGRDQAVHLIGAPLHHLVVTEDHFEEQLLDEDDQALNPVLRVTIEGKGVVGKKTLGEAFKTFQNAGIHRTQGVGYSPWSSVSNNLKALLALLLLVLILGHLGGGQRWAVLVMNLNTNSLRLGNIDGGPTFTQCSSMHSEEQ